MKIQFNYPCNDFLFFFLKKETNKKANYAYPNYHKIKQKKQGIQ